MLRFISASLFWAIFCFSCKEQASTTSTTVDETTVKKEVNDFMMKYGEFGRQSKYDSIAELYDKRGASFVNFQKNEYSSLDSIRASYKMADSIAYFQWEEPLIIDAITNNVATVAGGYHMSPKSLKDTLHFNYSAVLVKDGSGWKIKQENEMPHLISAKRILEIMKTDK
jgi:hypothetical protein